MRLGFIAEPTNNAYYRALIPLRALERRGHTVLWPARPGDDLSFRELASCELVHCYRRTDRDEDMRRLRERGIAVTFDNDDNYAAATVSDGGSGLAGNRHNRKVFRDMLEVARQAHLTTTPSPVLAEVYRRAGVENVAVIENSLERTMLGFGGASKHAGILVGWVAGREHRSDLDEIPIVDALRRLLDVHEDLRVLTVGVPLPLSSARYEHLARVPFPDLLKVTGRLDIGIAPLADSAFNRCRSNVKLKEYSSGAGAWLASPVEPYMGLGEQQGGMLVEDDGWPSALDELIGNARLRRRLAKRSLKWAKQQTIERYVSSWEEAFAAALLRARA